jgi:hypothetical protein
VDTAVTHVFIFRYASSSGWKQLLTLVVNSGWYSKFGWSCPTLMHVFCKKLAGACRYRWRPQRDGQSRKRKTWIRNRYNFSSDFHIFSYVCCALGYSCRFKWVFVSHRKYMLGLWSVCFNFRFSTAWFCFVFQGYASWWCRSLV